MSEYNSFIYGSSPMEGIVGLQVTESHELVIYKENGEGIRQEAPRWLLASRPIGSGWLELEGTNKFKWLKTFESRWDFWETRKLFPNKQDTYCVYDEREAALIFSGATLFKGLKVSDVSILSFDIETVGLERNKDSKVLIISNTFRRQGNIVRKMFCYDDYSDEAEMFQAWCLWVRETNPSIVAGHNIYGYDFPYLQHCATMAGVELTLGRNGEAIEFNRFESQFRRDGSQFYSYTGVTIPGREIVDTFFLAMKFDVATRKYVSYGLKNIIAQEGLEVKDRQFYDAGSIRKNYKVPSEWIKIKAYAEHDADDSLSLYDLMIPAFFYLCQSIPKTLQAIVNSATGAQINAFLVRSYLQDGHSIPEASEAEPYEGAISIGNPGVYKNVFKVDVASLYPSIILQYLLYDETKDPKGHFLKMVKHFTDERLANKAKGKETGERYYKDLEQAQKIVINSAYGMTGCPGLNFNSPKIAATITEKGRAILNTAIDFAKDTCQHDIVNADTDSIAISDGNPWGDERKQTMLRALNKLSPGLIHWEDDGVYEKVLVLKPKNYVLESEGKLKFKGASLKATLKESALREFIDRGLRCLIDEDSEKLKATYNEYIKEAVNPLDITRWSFKKTVTQAVLNPSRTQEKKALEALTGTDFAPGDKVYMYFTNTDSLKLQERWTNDHDVHRLLEKIFKTAMVFSTVVPIKELLPNYTLKRNQVALKNLVSQPFDNKII